MALSSVLVLFSLTLLSLMPQTLAQNVCTSSPYDSLLGLSTYAPATSYCSKSYKVSKVKTTTTVTVTAPPQTTTLVQSAVKRAPAKSTITSVSTVTCTGACSTFGSITASQSVPFISTFCSCIESASTLTVTKTVTPKTTKIVTKTSVTTVTPTSPTAAPTNAVVDPGFERGGISWGFGQCSVDCNYPHSGSCEALCPPEANTQASAAQNLATTAGPSTFSAYIGYIGNPAATNVPILNIYINGQNAYSSYICGDGTGVGAGGDCMLDGGAHYKFISFPFTATGTNTDLDITFLFDGNTPAANALTMLVDDVVFQHN